MAILAGLRVVEVSAFVAAPSAGLALAQMGAEVIRIDDIRGGLDYRRWPVTEDNTSLFWQGLNKNKRSVAIDIRQPEGRELARSIICASGEDAGILLTNFPPRGWLDYESLREAREDLIQLTVMGNRHGGSAVDYTVNPSIGVPMFTGPEGHEGPVNSVIPAWDCITGQMAVSGLLAAERHRRRTGEGQHIKLALEDVALATMGTLGFIAEAQLGVDRERSGNYLYGAFGRDFVSADGVRFMLVGLTPKQWRGLCAATGLGVEMEHLAQIRGLDFSREGDRYEARREIAALIESWVVTRNIGEIDAAASISPMFLVTTQDSISAAISLRASYRSPSRLKSKPLICARCSISTPSPVAAQSPRHCLGVRPTSIKRTPSAETKSLPNAPYR